MANKYSKILNITNDERNANYNEVSSYTSQKGGYQNHDII